MKIMEQQAGINKTESSALARSLGYELFHYNHKCKCGGTVFFAANRNCQACHTTGVLPKEKESAAIYQYVNKGHTIHNTARYINASAESVAEFIERSGITKSRKPVSARENVLILKPTTSNTVFHRALNLMHSRAGV